MESRRVLKRCLLLGVIAAIVGFWVSISFGRPASLQAQPSDSAPPIAKQIIERQGQASGRHDVMLRHESSTSQAPGTLKVRRRNQIVEDAIYGESSSQPEETMSPGDGVLLPGFDGKAARENRQIPDPGITYRF